MPVVVLIAVLPGLDFILVRLACILMLAALVLVFIGVRKPVPGELLVEAQAYVESQRWSGLTRHYSTEAVQENIEMDTGIKVSQDEARAIVNEVRRQNGWGPADYL